MFYKDFSVNIEETMKGLIKTFMIYVKHLLKIPRRMMCVNVIDFDDRIF